MLLYLVFLLFTVWLCSESLPRNAISWFVIVTFPSHTHLFLLFVSLHANSYYVSITIQNV